MALSYTQYLGDGVTRNFNITFPYMSKDHVVARVNGNAVPFTWLSASMVQLQTAPASNAVVDIRRVTPRTELLVDFVDGSTLVETDLDLSALQVFYLAQEAFDLGEASLGVTEDGSFSALNRRISNLLDPVAPRDAVTKQFVETSMTSQVNQATAQANAAKASETAAKTSETNAKTSETTADGHRAVAATKAAESAQSAAEALSYRNTAITKAGEASQSAADALASKNAAASSAAAAQTSAQQAALFDPSSYYLRTQIDTFLAAKAPKVNPTFEGVVKTPTIQIDGATGVNTLGAGSGDGASYSVHNILLTGKAGLGMKATGGLVNGFYDFQAGKWDVKGGFFKNGVEALYQNGGPLNGRLYTPIVNVPIVNNVATINLSQGSVFLVTLNQNITLDASGLPPEGQQQDWILIVRQDGTGGRTVSSTSIFAWAGETAMPSADTRANAYHIFAGIAWNNRVIGKSGGGFI